MLFRSRDNMQLAPYEYRIRIRGNAVAEGETRPNALLAMDSGIATGQLDGDKTKEPAFGLDAIWIDKSQRSRAETLNYTVVDPTSVVATHMTEVVKKHSEELLTRDEVSNLIEGLRERAPKLVEEAVPAIVKMGDLQKILQTLLRERVPIRDLETILEALADWGTKTNDADVLVEYVRNALRRTICLQHTAPGEGGVPTLACVTLDPSLEDQINAYIDRGAEGTAVNMPARVASEIAGRIGSALEQVTTAGRPPVVIASPQVRAVVRQILDPHIPGVAVLGYNEVIPEIEVQSMALVMPAETVAA